MKKICSFYIVAISFFVQGFAQLSFAQEQNIPAPVFQSVGISAEDEEFVRSKILESSPEIETNILIIPKTEAKKAPSHIINKAKEKKTIKIKKLKKLPAPKNKPVKESQKKKVQKPEHKPKVIKPVIKTVKEVIEPKTVVQSDELLKTNDDLQNHHGSVSDEESLKFQEPKEQPIIDEIDVDKIEPSEEDIPIEDSLSKLYNPVKKNFFLIAIVVILFPALMFIIMLKVLNVAKSNFDKSEQEEVPPEEAPVLREKPKFQKVEAKEDSVSKEEIASTKAFYKEQKEQKGQSLPNSNPPQLQSKLPAQTDSLSSVEDVLLVDGATREPSTHVDICEVSEDLTFYLSQKGPHTYLTCSIGGRETTVMKLGDAKNFKRVRKIESKGGKDIYMLKIDDWRGLVEIADGDARYLMDI